MGALEEGDGKDGSSDESEGSEQRSRGGGSRRRGSAVDGANDSSRLEDAETSDREASVGSGGLQVSARRASRVLAVAHLGKLGDIAISTEVEGGTLVGVGLALGVVGEERDGDCGSAGAAGAEGPEGSSKVTSSDESTISRRSGGHRSRGYRSNRSRGGRSGGSSGSGGRNGLFNRSSTILDRKNGIETVVGLRVLVRRPKS